jgi:hypothetical protein
MSKKIHIRLSADFVVTEKEYLRVFSKYTSLRDVKGDSIVEGEVYQVGYEDEDGNYCNEDGELE